MCAKVGKGKKIMIHDVAKFCLSGGSNQLCWLVVGHKSKNSPKVGQKNNIYPVK